MELSQFECNRYANDWTTKTISAICRITKLAPVYAHKLYKDCRDWNRTLCGEVRHVLQCLEQFGIPATSDVAKQFVNYWMFADSDER